MKTKLFTIALSGLLIGSMPLSFVSEAEGAKKKDKGEKEPIGDTLFDFSEENPGEKWIVVNDNVMGGRSKGGFSFKKDKLILMENLK